MIIGDCYFCGRKKDNEVAIVSSFEATICEFCVDDAAEIIKAIREKRLLKQAGLGITQ